jgi:hypothetical protein
MALTLEETKARLKLLDELTLLEILNVSSEDIVERFEDIIEQDYERYEKEVSDSPDEAYPE